MKLLRLKLFDVYRNISIYVGKLGNNRGQTFKYTLNYRKVCCLRLIGRLFFIFILRELNSRLRCPKMFVQVLT